MDMKSKNSRGNKAGQAQDDRIDKAEVNEGKLQQVLD